MTQTPKPDRRVQRTRRLLQAALIALILEKGYEAVTVQDILDRADVGRSTFYSHFPDKEALLVSQFEALQADFDQHWADHSGAEGVLSFSLPMFQHAQRYQRVYRAVVGKQSGQIIQKHLEAHLTIYIRQRIPSQPTADGIPADLLVHHLVHSFMSLLVWWLDRGLPKPAEVMAAVYQRLVSGAVAGLP